VPGEFYRDTQFPQQFIDHYRAQLVPDFNFGMTDPLESVTALEALLDLVGPAVIVTHSQSGDFGFHLSLRRPEQVRGIVEIEGASTVDPGQVPGVHTKIPFLTIYGDHVDDQPLYRATSAAARELVATLAAAGGDASLLHLPSVGLKGNGHMMMLELNSETILDHIDAWITEHVG
jgi:pimeloyl-ACP methyl ester carboxylesterase